MTALLSVAEARERILSRFTPITGQEQLPLSRALGRSLAGSLAAPISLPPYSNSSMDGFAVRAADCAAPASLEVIEDIPAGAAPRRTVGAGQAARIMTGACLPSGADAVVPVEWTDCAEGLAELPKQVCVQRAVTLGQYIRRAGQDIQSGQVVYSAGKVVTPTVIGALSALGVDAIAVARRPRVGLLSSGSELVAPGAPLGPAQIYDANTNLLASVLEKEGVEVIRLGVCPDDPQEVRRLLNSAVDQSVDLILTSAGVSVGAYDYVREVIQSNGALNFWRVNMRPGKPVAFGDYRSTPVLGLPGNPVSAFVACYVFVIPILRKLANRPPQSQDLLPVTLTEDITSDGRESYLRVFVWRNGGKILARLVGRQESSDLVALSQANALLIVPTGVKSLPAGSDGSAWLIDELENNE